MGKDLLNILPYWFTICGAICLTMYESILSNTVDFFDLLCRIILLSSAGVVGEQKKCSGFDSISSIGSLSVCGCCQCVPDSCKICVEVICY